MEIKNNNKEINWKELQIINQKKFKLDDLYKVFCDGNIKKRLTAIYNTYYHFDRDKFFVEVLKINIIINNTINYNISDSNKKFNIISTICIPEVSSGEEEPIVEYKNYKVIETEWCEISLLNQLIAKSVNKYRPTNSYGSYYLGYIYKLLKYIKREQYRKNKYGYNSLAIISIEDLLNGENELTTEDDYEQFYIEDMINNSDLTARQKTITKMMLNDIKQSDIADKLNLSVRTIKRDVKEIKNRLRRC